jgi:hypothetical protein
MTESALAARLYDAIARISAEQHRLARERRELESCLRELRLGVQAAVIEARLLARLGERAP